MKNTTIIIFGKEVISKFRQSIPLTEEERELNIKEFSFDTEAEQKAFLKGVDEGIGWIDYYISE